MLRHKADSTANLSVHSQKRQPPDHHDHPKSKDKLYHGSSMGGIFSHLWGSSAKNSPPSVGHPQGAFVLINKCFSFRMTAISVTEMPLFLYLKEFLFFQHLPNLKKNKHRSIHNIRLQMIIDNQIFEFSNTCTVGASMVL